MFLPIFILGIVVRFFFFIFGLFKMPIAVDESLVGVMSLHILKGEFPIVYWGQTYMGTQESYLDAVLIYFFGPNAFSIRIFPLVFSILFMFFTYKLACRVYNRDVGLITLILLALPVPYLSIASAVIQPDTYVSTCTLGSIALVITYDLVFGVKIRRRGLKYLMLGLILGFALWMHILVISYIGVCLLFLFLKDKLLVFKKKFWIFFGGFIIGGLPFIWYNIKNNFATFRDVGTTTNLAGTISHFKALFTQTLHYLIGLKVMLCADVYYTMELPRILYWTAGIAVIALLIIVFLAEFKHVWRICFLSLKNVNGTSLLLVMALASIFVFCRGSRSGWKEVRYILPIMSVLPILCAQGLWTVKKFSKIVFLVMFSIIITAHVWGNVLLVRALNNSELVAEELDLQDLKPVIRFLNEHNIRHAYAHYCISYNLNYITKEEILCTNPYNERFLAYEVPFMKEVRASVNAAYIMHKRLGIKPDDFENDLRAIEGGYKRENLGAYTVFYDFQPPYKDNVLKEIPREKWSAESNYRNEDCKNALDGNIDTRWGSGTAQSPGMFFQIDLGRQYEISKIRFDLGKFTADFPRGYCVSISTDKAHWEKVLDMPGTAGIFWDGSHPRYIGNGSYFTAVFNPVKARYVKITQIGRDPKFDWSIAEIYIYTFAP